MPAPEEYTPDRALSSTGAALPAVRASLDLRAAQVTAEEVTIDAGTMFGDVLLLVPEGVTVEVRSRVVLGDVRQDAGLAAPAGAPRVILTGGSVFGDVKVRAQRLSERLVEAGRARLNR